MHYSEMKEGEVVTTSGVVENRQHFAKLNGLTADESGQHYLVATFGEGSYRVPVTADVAQAFIDLEGDGLAQQKLAAMQFPDKYGVRLYPGVEITDGQGNPVKVTVKNEEGGRTVATAQMPDGTEKKAILNPLHQEKMRNSRNMSQNAEVLAGALGLNVSVIDSTMTNARAKDQVAVINRVFVNPLENQANIRVITKDGAQTYQLSEAQYAAYMAAKTEHDRYNAIKDALPQDIRHKFAPSVEFVDSKGKAEVMIKDVYRDTADNQYKANVIHNGEEKTIQITPEQFEQYLVADTPMKQAQWASAVVPGVSVFGREPEDMKEVAEKALAQGYNAQVEDAMSNEQTMKQGV